MEHRTPMNDKITLIQKLLPQLRSFLLAHPIHNVMIKDNEFDNIVTDLDVIIQDRLERELITAFPDTSVFAEEADEHRFSAKMWIIDPIDGTKNFLRKHEDYAISIAYYENLEPVFGCVYDVVKGDLYLGIQGEGAWLNGKRLPRLEPKTLNQSVLDMSLKTVYALERKHQADVYGLSRQVFAHRGLGAASLSLCQIATGFQDIYVNIHLKLWDYAAARIVLSEVGGVTVFPFEPKQDLNLHSVFIFACNSPQLYRELMTCLFQAETRQSFNGFPL